VKTRSRYDTDGGRLTEESLLALLERNEGALRQPPSTLVPLAEETGGFAIGGTNGLSAGLERIEGSSAPLRAVLCARNRD
jgi:hypothetical protein